MSNIKALEELRGIAERMDDAAAEKSEHGFSPLAISIEHALGKVEEEIAERFMEVPVDAYGVPIRPGDLMALGDSRGEVVALTYTPGNLMPWEMQLDDWEWYSTQFAVHVQQDTVESLLEEFHGKLWSDDEEQMALLEKYAERIRKAVGE